MHYFILLNVFCNTYINISFLKIFLNINFNPNLKLHARNTYSKKGSTVFTFLLIYRFIRIISLRSILYSSLIILYIDKPDIRWWWCVETQLCRQWNQTYMVMLSSWHNRHPLKNVIRKCYSTWMWSCAVLGISTLIKNKFSHMLHVKCS